MFWRRSGDADVLEDGYRAFGPSTARGQEPRLFLCFRNNDYLILSYDDLESISNPPGVEATGVVLLRFRGSVPREVRIEGQWLLTAVRHLWRQQVAWLKETPEGWDGPTDGQTVITRMAVRELTRLSAADAVASGIAP